MADAFALANAFVRIRPDATGFRAESDAKLKAALVGVNPTVKLGVDTTAAKLVTADLKAYIEALVKRNYELRLSVNDKGVQAQLARDYAMLLMLNRKVEIGVSLKDAALLQAKLLGIDQSMDNVTAKMHGATTATRGFYGIWSILSNKAKLPLFGGNSFGWIPRLLVGIGVLHLAVDVLSEMLAILVPMTYALAAFALAGVDSFRAVFHELQNAHIVMDATQKTMSGFSGSLEKLHDAVRPAVFGLLGDAIEIVNSKTKEFNALATDSAVVLQRFGARIAVAIKSGGISEFLRNAASDLNGVLDVFGNLFGVLGNFLHAMPGIAQGLLNIAQAATHALEVFTGSNAVQGILRWGLLAHGAIVYVGLGATLAGKMIQGGMSLAQNAFTGVGAKLFSMGGRFESAGMKLKSFGSTAGKLAQMPWGWIALAAGLIAFFAVKAITAKDATGQWLQAMNAALAKANAVAGFTQLMSDQVLVSHRLAQAQTGMAQAAGKVTDAQRALGRQGVPLNQALTQQQVAYGQLNKQQQLQAQQSATYTNHLVRLAKVFGGVSEAQGLLLASGVTMAQMTAEGSHNFALLLEQVVATEEGYKMMGQRGGELGADMNAMNLVINDQFTAMQKLNQSWDTLMGVISGGQTNFVTFEQDLLSVNKALAGTGGTSRVVVKTFADAKQAATESGASMDGLNASSLQLRATWQTAFSGAQSLIDSLRNMSSIREGGFPAVSRAIKDMLKQLVLVGSTGKGSRAELVALAQEVDPNIKNFEQLTKWLGNTKGAGQDLNKLVDKMGGSIQDLAGDAKSLSSTLKEDLVQAFDRAKIAAGSTNKDITQLAKDVVQGTKASQMYHDESKLYWDFRKEGLSAKEAQRLIEAMTGAVFAIPKRRDFFMYEHGQGNFKIHGVFGGNPVTNAGGLAGTGGGNKLAAGQFISGGLPHRDSVLAMLMPGELVVPKRMVDMGLTDHLRGSIPGFAGGNFIAGGSASRDVMTGVATKKFDTKFVNLFTNQMEDAMTSAMKRAIDATKQMFLSLTGSGALGGSAAQNKRIAMRMFPWPMWMFPSFDYVEMREAGYSLIATNPSSGAYGMAQFINGPSEYYQWGGNPNTAGGQLTGMFNYIKSRYGNPVAAAAHERAFNWYGDGTDSALPGLAVVGEDGPELVNFNGGEEVLSFAKGGGVGLSDRVDRALRITRRHPHDFGERRDLNKRLSLWEKRAREERNLIRFGGLHGERLAHAQHLLHEYRHHTHHVEDLLRPFARRRHTVQHAVALLNTRETQLESAIGAARMNHQTRLMHRLESHLHFRERQERLLHEWLTNAETPWERHHRRVLQRRRMRQKGLLEAMGLDIFDMSLLGGSWARNLIAVMKATGGMQSFDRGGWLMPGATMAINNTGRPEKVGGSPSVMFTLGSGGGLMERAILETVRKAVREQGGGDVQVAFGSSY